MVPLLPSPIPREIFRMRPIRVVVERGLSDYCVASFARCSPASEETILEIPHPRNT